MPEGRVRDQGLVVQGTPQNTKSWPCWGREGSWGWFLWVCHCSHALSDLLRRVETGKTKITCKERSSFSYQPKASPALVPAKGRMKLHPLWGLLHVTEPREHWDSSGFRHRQKHPPGTFLQVPGERHLLHPGSAWLCWLPDRAAPTALLCKEHCRELELPLWHKQHDPGWKSWIHGMVWGPALIAHLPRRASPAIPALRAPRWAQPCQGFWGHTGKGKEPEALKNHYLGSFRLIGVNSLGRLKNSTANGKCGC